MKKSELVKAARGYLDAIAAGTDPVSGSVLPADSVGMQRNVRDAAAAASEQLGALAGGRLRKDGAPGRVDMLYDVISTLESLGAGRDPATGAILKDGDPMAALRVRRCMAFSAESVDEVFDKERGRSRASFRMPADIAAAIEPVDEPLLITGVVKLINAHNQDPERTNGAQAQTINDWLERDGILAPRTAPGAVRMPTDKGLAMGITVEPRQNKDGQTYDGVVFPQEAQRYIFRHLPEISAFAREARLEADKARDAKERAAKREAAIARSKKRSYGKQAEDRLGKQAEGASDASAEFDPWS